MATGLGMCACSSVPPEGASAVRQQRIIGGTDSPPADDAVMLMLTDRDVASVCSSVLIAPNLVMTARHCVSAEYPADNIHCSPDGTLILPSGGQLGPPASADKLSFFSGADVKTAADGILPGGTVVAIGQQIITGDGPSVCEDDIALVVLDRALTQAPMPLGIGLDVAQAQRVTAIGYGLTENTDPDARYSTRHRRDDVPVKYVGILPNTFTLGRSVCKGDSGGPALDGKSGAVLGVYSLGFPGANATDCSSEEALNYFVDASRYDTLLHDAFAAAGQPYPSPIVLDAGTDSGSDSAGATASDDAGLGGGAGAGAGDDAGGTAPAGTSGVKSNPGTSKSCQVSNVGGDVSRAPALLGALCAALVALRRRSRVGG